jgi:hypothetical protein
MKTHTYYSLDPRTDSNLDIFLFQRIREEMEGSKSVCHFYRVLQESLAIERIVASGHTPPRGNNVPARGIHCSTGWSRSDFLTGVFHSLFHGLIVSMLVQLARDLGEDFYETYWVRSVILLSPTMNHAEFPVIEVCFSKSITENRLRSILSPG